MILQYAKKKLNGLTLVVGIVVVTLAGSLGSAGVAAATPAHEAVSPDVSGDFCLSNDFYVCMEANGVGQAITTAPDGLAMNVTNVVESTNVCGGLHLYSFHNANGYWLRQPVGASTLNLSTTRDARAEWVYLGSGTYGSYANGCSSDENIIYINTNDYETVKVGNPPSGAWDEWEID